LKTGDNLLGAHFIIMNKMQKRKSNLMYPYSIGKLSTLIAVTFLLAVLGCKKKEPAAVTNNNQTGSSTFDADFNKDGAVNILVLGTSKSIKNAVGGFAPDQIANELSRIISADVTMTVNVVVEDIFTSKQVSVGLGQGGNASNYLHSRHSLMQYYYWPEGKADRMKNLASAGGTQWDYVVIGADPHIVAATPGYYSLGVNKIAAKVAEGGAKPLLLMVWPKAVTASASMNHYAEFTYRTAKGAKVELEAIPAGRAWEALAAGKKDNASAHPSPNGAYLTAACIYAHLAGKSAATTSYTYDDELAETAQSTVVSEASKMQFSGKRTFMSPFKSCDIPEKTTLRYNHTGSSSENGILAGLNWVFAKSTATLEEGGTDPIDFNYGRANTNFEPNKRYQIDPAKFNFSLGFPMQDNGNTGDVSMLYGLDKRSNETENGTDLGVALFMVRGAELPNARAIPIRTLFAQLHEIIPGQSAYRDAWHMHRDLDKAIAGYMYTLLTGKCDLGAEPMDAASAEWKSWRAHKLGYETAWNLMHLEGEAPKCK